MRIDTRLAQRLKKINPSSTLAITAKAKKLKLEGKDVIAFTAGECDFDTPDFIKQAAIKAINEGFTKYTPTSGIPELKKLICEKLRKENSLIYGPDQIVVSCGAKHSIFNTCLALVNPQDEVLIPSPYWVSYPEMVNLCAGSPRFIKTYVENDFKITPASLQKQISAKTKILILNSPSNPTGSVYEKEVLHDIADICVNKKIFVISDEIYEKLIYDRLEHKSIASLNKDIYNLTITVNGLSKSYSMTGWRIGYLAAAPDIAEAVSRIQDHSTSNPVSISQKASVAALSQAPEGFLDKIRAEFQRRRDYCLTRLSKMEKITYVAPKGAFYIFCGIAKTGLDSSVFSQRLLDEALVAVIPGKAFGVDDYVRLSFALSMEQLEKGLDKLEQWLNKLK